IAVELLQPGLLVRVLRRLHFLEHPRMAQDRALAEDQQAADHDVGAFDRDRDRRRLPAAAGEVARPEDDALAAEHFRSEEHTSELHSLMRNSYAVFCWKK